MGGLLNNVCTYQEISNPFAVYIRQVFRLTVRYTTDCQPKQGYALAYSASSVCQTESNLTNVYCPLFQEWLQEAAEHTTQ